MKLGYHSKNILSFILLFALVVCVDAIFGTYFTAASGATFAMAIPLGSISKTAECNMAGISTTLYFIDKNDIESFPGLGPQIDPASTAVYVGDFVLKANKFWGTMYSTKEMGELLGETDGATDGKFFRNKITAFYPRTNAQGIGLANVLKDTDTIVIAKEFSGGGQKRVIGTDDIPATASPSENSGKGFADEKGITFEFNAANCKLPLIYEGEIITENEVLFAPVLMDPDVTDVDVFISKRFVVGLNTGPIVLLTYTNMVPGDVVRIDYDSNSTGSLAFNGAFSATALLDTDGQWFEVTKANDNSLVITAGIFS